MCNPDVLRIESRQCDCLFWVVLCGVASVVMLGLCILTIVTMVTSFFAPDWTDWAAVVIPALACLCLGAISWAKTLDYKEGRRHCR